MRLPLVIQMEKIVHPSSSNGIFLEMLDKMLQKETENEEILPNFSSQSDAWLGNVLTHAPSLLKLEHRYSLFNNFAEGLMMRYEAGAPVLRAGVEKQ